MLGLSYWSMPKEPCSENQLDEKEKGGHSLLVRTSFQVGAHWGGKCCMKFSAPLVQHFVTFALADVELHFWVVE